MSCVQVGVGTTQWVANNKESENEFDVSNEIQCKFNENYLLYLTYVKLLLFLQLLVSPFAATSKRNNREGLNCFIVTLCLVAIWCSWVTVYVTFGVEMKVKSICIGIVTSASVVLIGIIIPKSYLMLEQYNDTNMIMSGSRDFQSNMSLAFFNSLPQTRGVSCIVPYHTNGADIKALNPEVSSVLESLHHKSDIVTPICQENGIL